jgi:opacity protein-like surface antigen
MRSQSRIKGIAASVALLLLAGLTSPSMADFDKEYVGEDGITFGPRASYFEPEDGDGQWYGGAQLRFFPGRAFGIEASADVREDEYGEEPFETEVQTIPLQASALIYLIPRKPVNVFLLGGAGWYLTRIDPPVGDDDTDDRFGLHAGGGVEFHLHDRWSIDGSYRYVWLEEFKSRDQNLTDKEFDDSGSQITVGLNYRFP